MRFILIGSALVCFAISFKLDLSDPDYNIGGTVKKGWEPLRDLFQENFENELDLGASLAIYHQGELVVDLWGGWFDEQKTKPYDNDTLQLVFSTSKGLVATAVALCVQRHLLNYTDMVTKYWPEYGQNGKENTTVADIMSHRAGLPVLSNTNMSVDDYLDWYSMIHALEKHRPYWVPGTQHGYHALTYGWLAGELVRRVDTKQRTLGQFIRDEISKQTQSEFYIGLPEEYERRVSPLVMKPSEQQVLNAENNLLLQALTEDPLAGLLEFNDPKVHRAEIPAGNGITNARSLARIYASLIGDSNNSKQLLNAMILKQATKSNTPENELDQIFNTPTTFGMGFQTYGPVFNLLGPGTFGHNGEFNYYLSIKTMNSAMY
ncbi:unnamed protein product [Didymodactylos carnosus]|uniref:Beta-lactamase-related domain-containing protein n=1 Tax=Didymodactylos carnosus TaxID=1234261 RepID=A0A8S2F4R7_9BILA|nr:unnamed protein product [Didymodactylos carnosus]CAF4188770.1 unnamed protein product [Didymodactylos carnosus]